MAQPDYRAALQDVTTTLLALHRSLIYAARTTYERATEERLDPYAVLQHLRDHPDFAWLQPLTSLLTDLDALLDQPQIGPVDAAAVRMEITSLIDPAEDHPDSFRSHLLAARQLVPDLVVTQAHLRAALAALPQPDPTALAELRQARMTWHDRARPTSEE